MATHGILVIGNEYEFTVREIKEAATNYVARSGPSAGTTFYCHQFLMQDDDNVTYRCQICEPKTSQSYCNVMDTMGFKVKSFTHEIHTIEFISKDGKPLKPVATLPDTVKSDEALPAIQYVTNGDHIRIAALQAACTFYTNRTGDTGDVIKAAEEFYEWLNC